MSRGGTEELWDDDRAVVSWMDDRADEVASFKSSLQQSAVAARLSDAFQSAVQDVAVKDGSAVDAAAVAATLQEALNSLPEPTRSAVRKALLAQQSPVPTAAPSKTDTKSAEKK
jgi:DNA-directed RNA polymerase specialized sigma24 family protein